MEPERLEPTRCGLRCGAGLRRAGASPACGWWTATGAELALVHTEPGSAPSGWIYRQQLAMPVILTPSVMVRRPVYDDVGGFNEDDVVEDYDMWLRDLLDRSTCSTCRRRS